MKKPNTDRKVELRELLKLLLSWILMLLAAFAVGIAFIIAFMDEEQLEILKDIRRWGDYRPVQVEHTQVAVKTPDCGISLYNSGKCLVQCCPLQVLSGKVKSETHLVEIQTSGWYEVHGECWVSATNGVLRTVGEIE